MRSEEWRPAAATRNRLPREARRPRPPGTTTRVRGARCNRSGRKSGEASAAPGPKSPRWSAGRRASPRDARRLRSAWPAASRAGPRVPRKHPTTLGAPPPLKFGGSEAKVSNPGRKNAPRERERLFEMEQWNEECVLGRTRAARSVGSLAPRNEAERERGGVRGRLRPVPLTRIEIV